MKSWLNGYNQDKKDQASFGVENFPARVFRRVINLTQAGTLRNLGIPFNGVYIESIRVAGGNYTDGTISLMFDHPTINADEASLTMKTGDSAFLPLGVSNVYLSWTAQVSVVATIVFLNDIDFRRGNQLVSINGQVSIAGSVSIAGPLPLPIDITALSAGSLPVYNTSTVSVNQIPPNVCHTIILGNTLRLYEGRTLYLKIKWSGGNKNIEGAYSVLKMDGKIVASVYGKEKSLYREVNYILVKKTPMILTCEGENCDSVATIEEYWQT